MDEEKENKDAAESGGELILGSPAQAWRDLIKKFAALWHLGADKWFGRNDSFFIHPKGYPEPFFVHSSEGFKGLPKGFIVVYGWNGDALFNLLGGSLPHAFTRSYEIPFVFAAMRDNKELTEHEQGILRGVDFTVGDDGLAPVFVSFRPGWMPWHLSKDEVASSLAVFNQALGVLLRAEADKSIVYSAPGAGMIWGRRQVESGSWEEGWTERRPFIEPTSLVKPKLSKSSLKKALELPDDMPPMEFAFDVIPKIALLNPEAIKQRGEDGRVPMGYFFAISPYSDKPAEMKECENGVFYPGDDVASLGNFVPTFLLKYFLKKGRRPKEIAVSSHRAMTILRNLQKELPFKVIFHEKLPSYDKMYNLVSSTVAKQVK